MERHNEEAPSLSRRSISISFSFSRLVCLPGRLSSQVTYLLLTCLLTYLSGLAVWFSRSALAWLSLLCSALAASRVAISRPGFPLISLGSPVPCINHPSRSRRLLSRPQRVAVVKCKHRAHLDRRR